MKRKNIYMIMILGMIFISPGVFAQNKFLIEGRVSDQDGKPLEFVNVFIKNTSEGTMTGEDGKFKFFTTKRGKIELIASMVGYKKYSKEIELGGEKINNLNIILKETAILMKESVVSASSFGSEKEKGLVINNIDILTTPGGAADIYQALKTLPGMTQVSESAELYVRGGDPTETITIIDQSPVYHPFTFESGYGGLFSNVKTSVIKSLFFSAGGFSAKYGNALSGVLDVHTASPPEHAHVNVGLSMANASITAGMPVIADKLGFYFDAEEEFTKPIFWLNGGGDRLINSPFSQNFTGGIDYKYSGTGRLKLFTILADDNEGVKVERAEFNGTFNGDSKNAFVNLQNSYFITNNLLMKNALSYNRYNDKWLVGVLNLNTIDKIYNFRNDFEYELNPSLKILTGFEIEKRTIDYQGTVPVNDYDIRPGAPATVLNAAVNGSRMGAYSEIQSAHVLGIRNAMISAGIRYDRVPELSIGWTDPRVSAAYNLNKGSSIRFSFGIFHQLPDPKLFRPEDGNPDLKPMEAVHYILSYDYSVDEQNSFRIETYYKKYLDLPLDNTVNNYSNDGYGFAQGVDMIYKGIFPYGITGWISYGYINTKRLWLDYGALCNSSYDVTNNLSIIMKYNLTDHFQLGLSVKYATGRPFTPVVSSVYSYQLKIYVPEYAPTNSGRFPDYKRIDLRLTYFANLTPYISAVIYMEGLNIFDFDNIFGYSYSPDYSERTTIQSYFGQRMLVFGCSFGM
ncbi:MAG: TonB-dependent receptor [Ignavibacteriaceae bacterium]